VRSIADILNLVTDGKVPSKEDAAAIIEEEAAARVAICKITTKDGTEKSAVRHRFCYRDDV